MSPAGPSTDSRREPAEPAASPVAGGGRRPELPVPGSIPPLQHVIPLLRLAAERLAAAGQDLPSRIRSFRGLYYGTRHSLDFEKRRSGLRNLGFNLYLQSRPPQDPSAVIGADLARSIKAAAQVSHAGRTLDLSHVFVGLEARCSERVRAWRVPAHGGTGLELATWLGDLGGGAGLLAIQRMDTPSTRATALLFSSDTYDLSSNLEGDLAAYLVARPRGLNPNLAPPSGPSLGTVPAALQDYAGGGSSPPDWPQRHRLFTQMIGGVVGPAGIANRTELTRRIQAQTAAFGAWYLLYRLHRLGRFSRASVLAAGRHLTGASAELADIFVELLQSGIQSPEAQPAPVHDPEPRPAGAVPLGLRLLGTALA